MQKNSSDYHPWIQAIVVVEFDLDEGQKVLLAVPKALAPSKDKQISMLAFPDSNCCSQNQTLYKYIFKTCEEQLGFVCFKQKKDSSNKRGYSQKSFVVLTKLPFLVFFQQLAEFLVFKLYGLNTQDLAIQLQKLLNQSKEWPDPEPLSRFKLPVLDYCITINTPNYQLNSHTALVKAENFPNSARKEPPTSIEEGVVQEILLQMGKFQEVRLTQVFAGCEEQLWSLWQSSMLNKPLLIMGETPYQASQAVLAAVSLINPIEYAGDIYPYLTVYNKNLNELQGVEQNVLLGGTNPLFTKLFNKSKVEVVQVGATKTKKHLRPIRELFIVSGHQHHRLVNESALRKYFYKINCGIVAVLDQYLDSQTNDLKFFNQKEFLRFVRKRQSEDPLDQILEGRKAILSFWQEFVASRNFLVLLRGKHVVRNRN